MLAHEYCIPERGFYFPSNSLHSTNKNTLHEIVLPRVFKMASWHSNKVTMNRVVFYYLCQQATTREVYKCGVK